MFIASQPKLAIVGEAWGEQEERALLPFFGPSGQELTRQLRDVGIDRNKCLLTNVFNHRPPNNEIRSYTLSRAAASYTYPRVRPELVARFPDHPWPDQYVWTPIVGSGGFLHPEYLRELARLRAELLAFAPALVIALGNTACWALLSTSGIGKLRGYIYPSSLIQNLRVLPTFHPSSVLRQYSQRPIVLADLAKALRLASPVTLSTDEATKAQALRTLWIEPAFGDLQTWWDSFVPDERTPVSVDIETFAGTITCVGFGTVQSAISVPLWDKRKLSGSYWDTEAEERLILSKLQSWFESPNPKVLQNAQYDLQYIWKTWGMVLRGPIADTMLMHHALQPEMAKDLGFLGSAYTDVPAWKNMRKISAARAKAEKKDA